MTGYNTAQATISRTRTSTARLLASFSGMTRGNTLSINARNHSCCGKVGSEKLNAVAGCNPAGLKAPYLVATILSTSSDSVNTLAPLTARSAFVKSIKWVVNMGKNFRTKTSVASGTATNILSRKLTIDVRTAFSTAIGNAASSLIASNHSPTKSRITRRNSPSSLSLIPGMPGTSRSRKSFGKAAWARSPRTAAGHFVGALKRSAGKVRRGKLDG